MQKRKIGKERIQPQLASGRGHGLYTPGVDSGVDGSDSTSVRCFQQEAP
jgi:hypothetical protein